MLPIKLLKSQVFIIDILYVFQVNQHSTTHSKFCIAMWNFLQYGIISAQTKFVKDSVWMVQNEKFLLEQVMLSV